MPSLCRPVISLLVTLACLLPYANRASAQSLIRDTEIESNLRAIANPIFEAAKLTPGDVDIYVVRDPRINAFVAGGQNLFIHTGLLQRAETADQVEGVIAHETGHIAGGHLARREGAQERAGYEMIISSLLGLAAAVAGAPQAGLALFAGGATLAQRGMLAFSRVQEQSADQAGVTFLADIHQPPTGMLEFFHILENSNYRIYNEGDVFLRTHPLTRDRIAFIEAQVAASPYKGRTLSPAIEDGFARSRAKLDAFLNEPSATLSKYTGDTIIDRYARAIAYYRQPDLKRSIDAIDELIRDEPRNPYFYELKGQMLFENGRTAEAIAPYREAVRLAPEASQIRFGLARALLEQPDRKSSVEAASLFREVVAREPLNAQAWRFLGVAEGKAGNAGAADMALAESAVLRRDREDARMFIARAEQAVTPGDPNWLRLQDLRRAADDLKREGR